MFEGNPDKWTPEFFDRMRMAADPEADKVIEAVFSRSNMEEINKLLVSLIYNEQPVPEELPEEVRDYFSQPQPLPSWTDQDLITKAEDFFEEHSLIAFSILGCASLPECYSGAIGAKVLGLTGQLEDHIHRRIMETIFMVVYVLVRGGLGPKGQGIRIAQKVRLMHAAIRSLILSNEKAPVRPDGQVLLSDILLNTRWDKETNGLPLNQETMGITYLAFSYVILRCQNTLEISIKPEQKPAYFHIWNVVGHLLGVDETFYVNNMADAEKLWHLIMCRIQAPSDDGTRLTHVLMCFLGDGLKSISFLGPILPYRQIPKWLARKLMGKKTANLLGIPWGVRDQLSMWLTGIAMYYLGITQSHIYGGLTFSQKIAKWVFRKMGKISHNRIGNRPAFVIPDQLKKHFEE